MKNKHIYVLGTGLSHDGSVCLLKDGRIAVAIEKERLTRKKHDGHNDRQAMQYCLDAENITIDDVDLIVQNALIDCKFEFGNSRFRGERLIPDTSGVKVVTISHHLAHAYSTVGTCSFDDFNVLVIDGNGNPYDVCIDLEGATIPEEERILPEVMHQYYEKDSYYSFKNGQLRSVYKDFSVYSNPNSYPMHPSSTIHSIGGMYAAASEYCLGGLDDVGKLMGLAPYGRPRVFDENIFDLRDGRVFVNYDWMKSYRKPIGASVNLKKNFQYYADIAYMIQRKVEEAILYVAKSRLKHEYSENLCYSGGVALNAVANAKLLKSPEVQNLYIEPAAGDNGIAIGCAFYGWLEVMKKERVRHNGSTAFGISYPEDEVLKVLQAYSFSDPTLLHTAIELFFKLLEDHNYFSGPGNFNEVMIFNILDHGVYQIRISEGKLKQIPVDAGNPSCKVNINSDFFYKGILDPKLFMSAEAERNIDTTNFSTLEIFNASVNWESLKSKLDAHIISKTPQKRQLKYRHVKDIAKETAKLLANGSVIGWFQEGCEFGPRALGRRSILADPRNEGVRDFINAEIKFREDFRPFAPSVLKEDAAEYFDIHGESPYMILVAPIKDKWRNKLKSVVHEDGSCRIQTVTRCWNEKYFDLLAEFKKVSEVSVLLNTSFNKRGTPIVETPKDSLDFFFSCKLDNLVMGNYLIEK